MVKKLLPLVAAAAIIVSLGCEKEGAPEEWSQADWTNAGWESWVQGNYEAAESGFGNALKVDPYYAEAHAGMGWTLLRTQNIEDAVGAFETAVLIGERAAGTWSTTSTATISSSLKKPTPKGTSRVTTYTSSWPSTTTV